MEIRPVQPEGGQGAHLQRAQAAAAHGGSDQIRDAARKADEPRDTVKFSSADMTHKGSVPVIIQASSPEELVKLKAQYARNKHVTIGDDLPLINAFTAEVSPNAVNKLFGKVPDGSKVYIDREVRLDDPLVTPAADRPNKRKLDVAVPTMGVDKVWAQGFKGKGVTIAVIDTGIHPHADLKSRIIGFKDFVNGEAQPYDDQGHGTHVAGDAAGDGTASNGKYVGTAPEANLVGIKALDKNGAGRFSDIIKGIQWAVQNQEKYGIRVINMSLGGPIIQSYKDDPVAQAAAAAMDHGIISVVAAGNSGPKAGTIGSPGSHPRVLTIGALNDMGTVSRADDTIAKFSSRGPTSIDGLTKPDILSPGVMITAANSPGSSLDQMPQIPHVGQDYITISGTSMATPVAAGMVADIISANPKLTPDQIKELFTTSAQKLNDPKLDANQQGFGVINPEEALKKALGTKA